MKIRMAKGTNFLILSFLSLVMSGYAFTFHIDKQKDLSKQLSVRTYLKTNNPQAIDRSAEEQTNWILISIAVLVVIMAIMLLSQQIVQVSKLPIEVNGCKINGM
jgi:hypothetical protein